MQSGKHVNPVYKAINAKSQIYGFVKNDTDFVEYKGEQITFYELKGCGSWSKILRLKPAE